MAADRYSRRFAILTAGVVALILYGSLYPFAFHACGPPRFAHTGILSDRGDVLSNVLLYLPLGFFGTLWLRRSALTVAVAGTALSFAIELAQSCDYGRVPSLADIYANGAGTVLGCLAASAVREPGFAAVAVACWIGSRLLPYLPSLNLGKYRAAIHAVFATPQPLPAFHYFALWLAAAAFLSSQASLVFAIVVVLAARVAIVDVAPLPAEAVGAVCAAILWSLVSRWRGRFALVATVFLAFVVVSALEPFHFLAAPRHFGWIPFESFMNGPRENASRVFLEKSFTYAALVWLPVRAGMSLGRATALAAGLVFVLRVAQVYLPGRSAEVTDAVMVLMMAGTMAAFREHGGTRV